MTSWSLPILQGEVQGFVQEGEEEEGRGRSLSDQVPGYSRDQNETSVLHHLLPKNQVNTSGASFLSCFSFGAGWISLVRPSFFESVLAVKRGGLCQNHDRYNRQLRGR